MLGALLPSLLSEIPGPETHALADRLRAVESRDVTFLNGDWPVFWTDARGANVRDADGNVYVDLGAGFGVALLGHAHPAVVDALRAQAERLLHGMGDVHPPALKVELLEALAARAPWPEARVVLGTSGSDAIEAALKTTHLATGRPGVIAFEGAYHGLTVGALAATHRAHFRAPFQERLYGGVGFAPFPGAHLDTDDPVEAALSAVRELLRGGAPNGDPIGTLLVEPLQGRAGTRVAPSGFMTALSDLASDEGALVVADEVFTGVGRCGAFLASPRVGLRPDVVCLGKALGGGVPVSACMARADVMDAWPPSTGEARHTSTFLGNPLGCAAALAVLDALDREGVVERAQALGDRLRAALDGRLGERGVEAEIRGLGLLLAVAPRGEGAGAGVGARAARAALARGVLVLPAGADGEVVQLTPPVCLTDEQLAHAAYVVVDGLAEAA